LGISTLPSGTIRDSHFTTHWTEKGRFPTLQPLSKNQTFGAGVTKKYKNFSILCLCFVESKFFFSVILNKSKSEF